jgi:integrase
MACVTKKRGRWCVDFYDQHGKRRLKMMPEGANKKQAMDKLEEIRKQVDGGVFLPTKQIPKFSEVAKDWIEWKKPNLRITTWECYEGHTRTHFSDLNHLPINRINVTTVEKFITTKRESGIHIGTLRKVLVTLGQIFNYAVRHRYMSHNPLKEAERPRDQSGEGERGRDKIQILSPGQIKALLDQEENPQFKMLFMLTIFTGARQGEILGAKWSDIDWGNSQIHIQRTFNKGHFFTPKTQTSNRRVDIGPTVLKALKEWKLACPRNEHGLLFASGAGQPINYSNLVQRHFRPALKDAELPMMRFHDLRHTFASLLIEQGENVKYIQTQLGHSSPTVTLNVYAHLMKPTNQEAACRLENTIFSENGDQMETNQ